MNPSSLFLTFLRIGLFTIGGGYAMIPMIEHEVVDKHGWIQRDELLDLIAVAQSCPGVFAVNIAILVGYKQHRLRGALAAALGCTLPSFVIILAIALLFHRFQDNPLVASAFRGIRPVVVALITIPVFRLGRSAHITRYTIAIPILATALIAILGLNPIYIILGALLLGYLCGKLLSPHNPQNP